FPHGVVTGEVDVDRDAHTAFIVMKVDRGPYARFRKTIIKGLHHVPESVVRNRLDWKPGDSLRLQKLQVAQGRLYQLGLFSSVIMDFEKKNRPRNTDVYVSLTEARPYELRLGGGVSVSGGFGTKSVIQVRQRTSYTMRGVLTPLSTLRLEARPGWEWRGGDDNGPVGEATATLERPDLFFPLVVGSVTVGFEQSQLAETVLRGPLLRPGLSRPFLDDRLQIGVGWRFRILDFDPNAALDGLIDGDKDRPSVMEENNRRDIGMIEPYRLGVVEETVSYDWREPNPLDPRYGIYAGVTLSEGGAAVGGRLPFAKLTGDARGYLPFLKVLGVYDPHRRLVLAGRAFYGRVLGGNPLPFTERFFDGGATGHRGFAYQELSPRVTEEKPGSTDLTTSRIGGEEQFLGSGEIRVDVANIKSYPFGIVLFSDVGDVVAEPGDLDFTHLHWAAGFGLRWSPVVAIRLDFGYRLNRHGPEDPVPSDRFAFHFSLGQAF
ncbi:MAG TPA: BamA/TamA family outer membrane protein, partial [Kofleriaceae bacterium]|nr:BamA/TamA family outer membrane protein [Kofleriaceae bacterium]